MTNYTVEELQFLVDTGCRNIFQYFEWTMMKLVITDEIHSEI